jgi:hypothetical protein
MTFEGDCDFVERRLIHLYPTPHVQPLFGFRHRYRRWPTKETPLARTDNRRSCHSADHSFTEFVRVLVSTLVRLFRLFNSLLVHLQA